MEELPLLSPRLNEPSKRQRTPTSEGPTKTTRNADHGKLSKPDRTQQCWPTPTRGRNLLRTNHSPAPDLSTHQFPSEVNNSAHPEQRPWWEGQPSESNAKGEGRLVARQTAGGQHPPTPSMTSPIRPGGASGGHLISAREDRQRAKVNRQRYKLIPSTIRTTRIARPQHKLSRSVCGHG